MAISRLRDGLINLLRYLAEKILLLNTTNFRGDYLPTFAALLTKVALRAAKLDD